MLDTRPASPKSPASHLAPLPLRVLLCIGACCTPLARFNPVAAAPPTEKRYTLGLANGSRHQAHRISGWEPDPPSLELDDRQWWQSQQALRWIYDSQSAMAPPAESWIETWTGDRLPGVVQQYVDDPGNGLSQPPHVVVRSVTPCRPPRHRDKAQVRVRASCVRRIVWHNDNHDYQPGTVRTRDGRRIDFRAIRWSSDRVTLLADSGRYTFSFRDLSELNFPSQPAWPEMVEELALLAPDATGQLVQFETSRGVLVTTSWQRQRVARPRDRTKARYWLQGVQPAWSLDVIWLPGNEIPLRRFFQPQQVPLSRLSPSAVIQRSPLAQEGRPWRRDRNVEGGWLTSGPGIFGWGFGVHAHNELHFPLPSCANAVSGFVGLDALAGTGGCIRARLSLSTPAPQTLFEEQVIVGSHQVFASGMRRLERADSVRTLVLQVGTAHTQRPRGADPLDIRDSADWLDPMLYLDRDALRQQIADQTAFHIYAWRDWQWHVPPATHVRFHCIWDEFSQADSHFALGVSVQGTEPLRLVRSHRLAKTDPQLRVIVSCPRPTHPPVRMQVLANGTQLASFHVPVLDRSQFDLSPQIIPLKTIAAGDDAPVEFEIRQFPGSSDTPVQWHAIEFQ